MEPNDRTTTPTTTSRRELLRRAAVIGVGGAALLGASTLTATPAFAGGYQSGWRVCHECKTMVWGNGMVGKCGDSRVAKHNTAGSWDYKFLFNTNAGTDFQSNWKYCRLCSSMYFGYGLDGHCPGGRQTHDGTGSFDYSIYFGSLPQSQSGWAYCRNCHGLFFGPWQASSACPAFWGEMRPHDGNNSYNYQLWVQSYS
ncbi:hypothetical protein DFJ67_5068 [Asanoa ferruginea]|uniref:Uncharacterized protein n=1 Tax=Asanoa ferruginea TaxID=53367 RepID=A0A3D9ZRD6_9ACTN|nr:hypothetical protein [Asanoa ferruginea]REF99042.1 hypothetical protein DFJ67_5068 [Asanoa ferruginea]GIF46274.1 hypothetical protein Afe04nite_08130 [Asanoa ferruginea]